MTTQRDIGTWFDEGITLGATHLVVVCDTFDWEDYPVYVQKLDESEPILPIAVDEYQHVKKVHLVEPFVKNISTNGQQVMEVYKLSDPKEEQIQMHRCFRY